MCTTKLLDVIDGVKFNLERQRICERSLIFSQYKWKGDFKTQVTRELTSSMKWTYSFFSKYLLTFFILLYNTEDAHENKSDKFDYLILKKNHQL